MVEGFHDFLFEGYEVLLLHFSDLVQFLVHLYDEGGLGGLVLAFISLIGV